jgi:hypothetical protein
MVTHIHIGLPKTGSTSLQAFFRINREALRSRGIVYPVTTGSTMLEAAEALFVPTEFRDVDHFREMLRRSWKKHNLTERGNGAPSAFALLTESPAFRAIGRWDVPVSPRLDFETCWRELSQQARSDKALLVSSEELGAVSPFELRQRTAFDGRDKRVLVYLRRQDFAIEATYVQSVKTGLFQGTIDEYVDDVLVNRNRARGIFDYRILLSDWWEAFGQDHVEVFSFEEDRGSQWIFSTALKALGLWLDSEFDIPRPLNRSLDPLFVEYLRRRLLAGTWDWKLVSRMLQLSRDPALAKGRPRGLLSRESRDRIRDHFDDGNSWIASKLFGEPCELFTSDAYPEQFVAEEYPGHFQLLDEATADVRVRK